MTSLRRNLYEYVGKLECLTSDTYRSLLHRLEHGALGLGTGTVDLVEQNEVGIYRTDLGLKGIVGHVECLRSDDVARKKVRGTLYPRELTVDGLGHDPCRGRLGKTRNRFEKDVSVGDHGDKERYSELLLAYDLGRIIIPYPCDDLIRTRGLFRCNCRYRRIYFCNVFHSQLLFPKINNTVMSI